MGQQTAEEIEYEQSEHSKIKLVPLSPSPSFPPHHRLSPFLPSLSRSQFEGWADLERHMNRFAPFVVPRHRRTQMFAVFLWSTLLPLSMGFFFVLWSVPFLPSYSSYSHRLKYVEGAVHSRLYGQSWSCTWVGYSSSIRLRSKVGELKCG